MELKPNNFDNKEVHELLSRHFIELRSVSPEGSTHVLDIDGLKSPSIKFWSFWDKNNLIGCGALKLIDKTHGEFKSIRISKEYQNTGYGKKLLNELFKEAKKLNISKISVETGSGEFFLPARKLFLSSGFNPCKPYAHYTDDPNSKYYNKYL